MGQVRGFEMEFRLEQGPSLRTAKPHWVQLFEQVEGVDRLPFLQLPETAQ